MAAMTWMPPVLARRAHRVDQIVIITAGARRMRAVGGIQVIAAEGVMERIWRLLGAHTLPAEAQRREREL